MAKRAFDDERTFLRVAALGSIRAASREAGVEPSSVSRRITALEHRLGTKLLERSGARSGLTEAGARYAGAMSDLLAQVDALETEISGDAVTPKGSLRVTASIDFGQTLIVPWLLEFRRQFPDVDVELLLSSKNLDLSLDDIDIAIRIGEPRDSALMMRKLASVPRVLVAAKKYLEKCGPLKTPDDLGRCEHIFFHAEHRRRALRLKSRDGAEYVIERRGGVTINAIASVARAVLDGHGVHLGPRWAFQAHIDSGDVVELFPELDLPAPPLCAVWKPAVVQPAKIRAFVDHMAQKAKETTGLAKKAD